jgi:chromosome segregation ATPase
MMFVVIGFLIAGMGLFAMVPLDWRDRLHKRAVRADTRRLEATTRSMADILSDRDRLRAEFAVTRHRLEETLEHTKVQAASQLAELNKKLGKKDAALKRARVQLKEQTAAMSELEARERSLRRALRAVKPADARATSRASRPARSRDSAKLPTRIATPRAARESLH